MYKKITVMLFLVALVLASVPNVYAKQKAVVLVENLVYTVKDVPVPDDALPEGKGQLVYAVGEGIINCNGVTACEDAGLNGQTLTIQQGFLFDIDGFPEAALEGFAIRTAGRLQLAGGSPRFFKGRGSGIIECSDETCDLTMELDTRIKGGGKLSFTCIPYFSNRVESW